MQAIGFPARQILIAALLAVLALVAFSFARVVVVEYQLRSQEQALRQNVAELKAENQRLKAQIAYLQTDRAIEQLAREELGWTMPGDTAVVVRVEPTPSPLMTPVAPDSSRTLQPSSRPIFEDILKIIRRG